MQDLVVVQYREGVFLYQVVHFTIQLQLVMNLFLYCCRHGLRLRLINQLLHLQHNYQDILQDLVHLNDLFDSGNMLLHQLLQLEALFILTTISMVKNDHLNDYYDVIIYFTDHHD